jgi:hypothetical protein
MRCPDWQPATASDPLEPPKALEAALLIAASADLTNLTRWVQVGQERATRTVR